MILHTRGGSEMPVAHPGNMVRKRAPKLSVPAHLRAESPIDAYSLRNLAQADPDAFVERVRKWTDASSTRARGEALTVRQLDGIDEREVDQFSLASMRPEHFRALKDALDFDVNVRAHGDERARSITTGAFPLLTSALVVAGVSEAYEQIEDPTPELVTDVYDVKRESAFAGVLHAGKSDITRKSETDSYTEFSASEESFHVSHLDQGFQVVISQALIEEADLGNIQARITAVGELAKTYMVEQVLRRVTDHDGSAASGAEPYALHGPSSPAGQALYVTTNTNLNRLPSTGNRIESNPLSDLANLEAARARLAGMKDGRGKRIQIPMSERILLIPDALAFRTWTLLNSVGTPGVFNEINAYGPNGPFRPRAWVSDARLDDLSASTWYYGAFRRQFRRKWKISPEVVTHGGASTHPYVDRREAMRVRIGWDMEVGAVDYVYVIQNLAGTTAPKDQ